MVRLRAACPPAIQVVVPEPVIWEWAQHAKVAAELSISEARRVDDCVVALARPQVPPVLELVARIERALPDDISVWRVEGEDALSALRAQVLQIEGAEQRGGIKTGAIDHLIAACVAEHLGTVSPPWEVVLVTGDKRLQSRVRTMERVRCARDRNELIAMVHKLTKEAEQIAQAQTLNMFSQLKESLLSSQVRIASPDGTIDVPRASTEVVRVTVDRVRDFRITDVFLAELQQGDVDRIGTAMFHAAAGLEFSEWTIEQTAVDDFEMTNGERWDSDGFVTAPIEFRMTPDRSITSARVSGEVAAVVEEELFSAAVSGIDDVYVPATDPRRDNVRVKDLWVNEVSTKSVIATLFPQLTSFQRDAIDEHIETTYWIKRDDIEEWD